MPGDQIRRLAELRIIAASVEIEAQLRADIKGSGPVLQIMRIFRERSAESLEALCFVNAEDPLAIRTLQNEVKRYDEFVEAIRDIIKEGHDLNAQLDSEEREEMLDILLNTAEGQREAIDIGLIDEVPRDA